MPPGGRISTVCGARTTAAEGIPLLSETATAPTHPPAAAAGGSTPVRVDRYPSRFQADDKRVIARYFNVGGAERIRRVGERVAGMTDREVADLLTLTIERFGDRHRRVEKSFERHFERAKPDLLDPDALSNERKLLLGSYFTMEYAIEAAALFNPSIVPHPDQSGVEDGGLRFIMSLRATGEGHVSSIVFRTGGVSGDGKVSFDPSSRLVAKMRVAQDQTFEKKLFFQKLIEMGAYTEAAKPALDALPAEFHDEQLEATLDRVAGREDLPEGYAEAAEQMRWLAHSNYTLKIPEESGPDEIVIFPTSENESRGIEDVRFTAFTDDDGEVTYYGTYTAYNGFRILPQLLETKDFHTFGIHTLNGRYVQNKGMALFPRKINGRYMMISRLDGENMFIMNSDNPRFWNRAQKLCGPMYPWEFVQIGNCGPPIETPAGWLLLTHGVGPVRRYCIGACLLDLDDPSRVIGHLDRPLLEPQEDERDGYVPNVVYSCGALVHNDTLVLPYAVSDSASTVATLSMTELLNQLTKHSRSCPLPDRRMDGR